MAERVRDVQVRTARLCQKGVHSIECDRRLTAARERTVRSRKLAQTRERSRYLQGHACASYRDAVGPRHVDTTCTPDLIASRRLENAAPSVEIKKPACEISTGRLCDA